MRIFPVLTAALVITTLFFVIFQRDALIEFASGSDGAAAATAQLSETADSVPAADSATDAVSVVARKSVARQIDGAVVLRGRTEAARSVIVRAETTARVVSSPLSKGTYVSTGQILCELDPGIRAAALLEATARRAAAQVEVDQALKLSQGGYASQTRVITARAGLESAIAAVKAAEQEIGRLTITAPFAGLLDTDTAELGEFVSTGGTCASIIQLDPIRIVGFVSESEVDRVTPGALAGGRLLSGRELVGEVTYLARSSDEATRTFRVEIEVANPDQAVRAGLTAEIAISAEGQLAHLLPQSALTLNNEGELGVRIVAEGNIVEFVPVEALRDTTEGIWISGLPTEADVITVGQEYVTQGVKVLPTFQELTQ
jgi:membrane fusion protein, multidrug efflux system